MFNIIQKFRQATNRLVLLDYDGTLVNLAPTPDKAIPSSQLLNTMMKLSRQENTDVIIITGRKYSDIKILLGNLSVQIISEHGASAVKNAEWKNEVLRLISETTDECPGSYVEEKQFTIAWHYRNSNLGFNYSRGLIRKLEPLITKHSLRILDGNKTLEIMDNEVGKDKAIRKLLKQESYDFILAIGDDVTDEEMFNELNHYDNAITIKVGEGNTVAKQKLSSPGEVLNLLNKL